MITEIESVGNKIAWLKQASILDFKIVSLIVSLINMLWFAFDHHFPTQDEAEHIINSILAEGLLRHFHPWNYHWWYQVLTINSFYPPVAYMVNGFFLLLFGHSRFTEELSLTFFLSLAIVSIYSIVRLLKGSRVAGAIATACFILYPLIVELGHSFFLDLPEVTMVALSLATLFWWRRFESPSIIRTIITIFVLGFACLTKQLVAAFILPLGLYLFFDFLDLNYPLRKPRWKWLIHILIIGFGTLAMGLPFILVNYKATHRMAAGIVSDFALKNFHWSYFDRMQLYLPLFIKVMSPILFFIFALAIIFLEQKQQKILLPVTLSTLGGFLLMLLWPANAVDARYLAPILILPAIYSGNLLAAWFRSGIKYKQISAMFLCVISVLQYVYINFVPYPLSLPQLPIKIQSNIGQRNFNPVPLENWGHEAIIDTISKIDGSNPVYLNVLTNLGSLHVHAFDLLLQERANHLIMPTSSRAFTLFGDKVSFDPDEALRYQWYLWKTGTVGYKFFDAKAAESYMQLVQFVRGSGNYKLMLEKPLPDGSQLILYRKIERK